MRLARLELNGFRCWEGLDLAIPSGRVALVGPNASGKTSIVEAAWYAATLGSHRAPDPALIQRSRVSAVVRAHTQRDVRQQVVEVEIRSQGASRVRLDGEPLRRKREVLGVLRACLFAPERVEVVRGDPLERRRFLDEILVQVTPRLAGVLRDYERALRQRNALLRESAGRRPDGIEVWDAQLSASGGEISARREAAIRALAPHAAAAWAAVAGRGLLEIAYRPNIPHPGVGTDAAAWAAAMLARIEERRSDEIIRAMTLVGPHRDDVAFGIDGLPARTHASQGEAWVVTLALALAAWSSVREATGGDEPVLLLDDALEPLDPARRERVAAALPDGAQAIITAADPGAVPDSLEAKVFHVGEGRVDAA